MKFKNLIDMVEFTFLLLSGRFLRITISTCLSSVEKFILDPVKTEVAFLEVEEQTFQSN